MCSGTHCGNKKTFQSLEKSEYQCLQCLSTCQLRNIPFEEETNWFFLKFGQGIFNFVDTEKSIQDVIGDVYCPTCPNEKCVFLSTNKISSFYDCKKCKSCSDMLNISFKDQKLTIMLSGGDGIHCFARKASNDYEKVKPSPL